MISRIRIFLQSLQVESIEKPVLSIEIATAVLLFEVIKADHKIEADEKQKMTEILQSQFPLSDEEIEDIVELAQTESDNANDFYQYTSLINDNYTLDERIHIVELLWQLAYADGHLDVIEEHIIRRIADLLHLRHQEFIQCKIKVQQLHSNT